ncbi:MAG: hypothetical protein HY827_06010 [Actinobacteria bacterium]|nr:hypothetical protein [Actinomycetota bacterium]
MRSIKYLMEIDQQARAELEAELQPGERLLWCGRPDTSRVFVASDLIVVPLTILWIGVMAIAEFEQLTARTVDGDLRLSWFTLLWGVVLLLAGLYMAGGRFVIRRAIANRIAYAITDHRVLSVTPTFFADWSVKSAWLGSFPPVTLSSGVVGQGSIVVGVLARGGFGAWTSDPGLFAAGRLHPNAVIFWNIADARNVKHLVDRTIAGWSQAGRANVA